MGTEAGPVSGCRPSVVMVGLARACPGLARMSRSGPGAPGSGVEPEASAAFARGMEELLAALGGQATARRMIDALAQQPTGRLSGVLRAAAASPAPAFPVAARGPFLAASRSRRGFSPSGSRHSPYNRPAITFWTKAISRSASTAEIFLPRCASPRRRASRGSHGSSMPAVSWAAARSRRLAGNGAGGLLHQPVDALAGARRPGLRRRALAGQVQADER